MKSVKYASALLALGLASQASAATVYAWCEVQAGSLPSSARGYRYNSGIVEIPDGPEARNFEKSAFADAFVNYVRSIHASDRIGRAKCAVHETLLGAREDESMEYTSDIFVHTGWLGGRAAAVDRGPKRSAPTEELILAIPSKKSPADTGDAPARRKKSNAEADAEYALKLEQYNRETSAWREKVAEAQRLDAAQKARHADAVERAKKARAEWEKAVAACKAGDRMACMGATKQ